MPRSRTSRPSRPYTAPAVVRPPPAPPAVQQAQSGGIMRGMGGAIAEGMAFGGGSAVAHRAVDAVMGPRTIHHEVTQITQTTSSGGGAGQSQEADVCVNQAKAFKDCLKANANDIGKCQFYVDMLNECRKSAGIDQAPQSSTGW
ncbi:hypothetical protein M758_2G057400 [Ceratodon purpureus]|nr:hypothetical protein M758_2G057400 [Ceratodon purpureus]